MQRLANPLFLITLLVSALTQAAPSAEALYQKHCQSCHGEGRIGSMGPALLPESLERIREPELRKVIAEGRPLTQMPGFAGQLAPEEIDALVAYVKQAPAKPVRWEESEIKASHVIPFPFGSLPDKPVFNADLMNLFLVVELGDHHITVLDGDKFEPIHRFKTRFALHGGPKYSSDGRYVFMASRDGWISKFDLYNLKTVAEIRVGINTRNLAVSSDGRYVMVANYLPESLVLLDSRNLGLMKVFPVADAQGKGSRVSAVYNAPPRNSFIAALKDVNEVWEFSYQGAAMPEVRRVPVESAVDDFFFDPGYTNLIGASRAAKGALVIALDSGKTVAQIPLSGMPHLGSGITWDYQGRRILATPNLHDSKITFIDMTNWQVVKELNTDGPGFFMRSHDNSPYAWADVFFGPNKDEVHIIDKSTLEIVKTLKPVPGKTAAHTEFNKDGSKALLSIWDMNGELLVYDAKTLEITKRLPMSKPSGKYNVYNKTHYEDGTSH